MPFTPRGINVGAILSTMVSQPSLFQATNPPGFLPWVLMGYIDTNQTSVESTYQDRHVISQSAALVAKPLDDLLIWR